MAGSIPVVFLGKRCFRLCFCGAWQAATRKKGGKKGSRRDPCNIKCLIRFVSFVLFDFLIWLIWIVTISYAWTCSWDVSSNNIEKPSTIAGLLHSSKMGQIWFPMDRDGIRAGMMRPVLLAKRQPWVQSLRKVAVKKMLIMDGEQKESFEKEAQIMSLELRDKLCFVVGWDQWTQYVLVYHICTVDFDPKHSQPVWKKYRLVLGHGHLNMLWISRCQAAVNEQVPLTDYRQSVHLYYSERFFFEIFPLAI